MAQAEAGPLLMGEPGTASRPAEHQRRFVSKLHLAGRAAVSWQGHVRSVFSATRARLG